MRYLDFKILEAADLLTQYNQGGKKALPAIKDLQTKLQAAGFNPNGIDGKYGPGTFKAVQAYQQANGLSADGQAGDSTLAKINTAPAKAATATPAKAATAAPTATPATGTTATAAPTATPTATPVAKLATPATDTTATGTGTTATPGQAPDSTPTKAQDGGAASTYNLGGKPATRAEYEKQFGTDVSGRQNDVANLNAKIQGSSKAASDEKQRWVQAQLEDPNSKYNKGVPSDKRDPNYPAELKAIDDKYAAQSVADQQKIKDLSSDPRVANNVKSDFDKALDGDDDAFGKTKSTMKDPFADDPEGDAAFDKALDGDDDINTNTTTNTSNNNTTSNSTSTSNVTTTGGTTNSVQQSGGGSTTRFASKYADSDESNKLRAQAKDIERNQMNAFADTYQKDNPTASKFDFTDAPEYKNLEKQADDLKKQAQAAKTLVHPSGEVDVNGKTTYYGKGANKDGSWDGQQFQPTNETKLYFDIIKELAGI
jgi:peptidoglycan hydrolase-like protein with peptidoglycan-binding domain